MAPSSNSSSSSAMPISHSQRSVSPEDQPPALKKDVSVGSIVLLPSRNQTTNRIHCVQPDCRKTLHENAYNHPVVILRMSGDINSTEKDIMCHCAIITSNPNPDRFNSLRSLPIARGPKMAHPPPSTHLPSEITHLEQGAMKKDCYVTTAHVWAIPLSFLRVWTYKPFEKRLSQESYLNLMKMWKLAPTPWVSTEALTGRAPAPVHQTQIPVIRPIMKAPVLRQATPSPCMALSRPTKNQKSVTENLVKTIEEKLQTGSYTSNPQDMDDLIAMMLSV